MSALTALPPFAYEASARLGEVATRSIATTAAKKFVWIAIGTYVLGLAALAAISMYANPWGNYGEAGFLDPAEYNDRLVKTRYLDAISPAARPPVLVLGSSSLMSMRGEDIERAVGKKAFNAYVSGAKADDHLCLLRHLVFDLDYRPDLLVVGLETWTFSPPAESGSIIPGARRALINVPQLIQHHPYGQWYRRTWAKAVDMFSRDHLAAGWRALFKEKRVRAAPDDLGRGIIAVDGALVYRNHDPITLGGRKYALEELRRIGVTTLLQDIMERGEADRLERLRYFSFDRMWQPGIERFEEFLQLCAQVQVKVVIVRPPLHPLGWSMLGSHPEHERHVEELDALIDRWQRQYPVILEVVDASRVENFDGDAADFYDEMHCGPENSKRIVNKIAGILASP